MIRFRFAQDEKHYLLLAGDLQRQLATHLPPEQVSIAMRNLGKLQELLMLEGVRQGAVAAGLARAPGAPADIAILPPFQLHAAIYGACDTPLRAAEERWIQTVIDAPKTLEAPWTDPSPMQFAPTQVEPMVPPPAPPPAPRPSPPEVPSSSRKAWDDWTDEDIQREIASWREDNPELAGAQERPAMLDTVRDVLRDLYKQGYRPGGWSEMILRLHVALGIDAGFLDIQLGTPMGRTVLAQAGYPDMQPPPSFDQALLRPSGDLPQDGS